MMKKFFDKQPSALFKGAALTVAMAFALASCSENDMPTPPNGGEDGTTTENVGASVNVINDPALLSQYVTNYKHAGNGAMRLSRAVEEWSMPVLPTDFDGMTIMEQDPYSKWVNYGAGNYVIAEGTALQYDGIGFNANPGEVVNLYIFGKLTAPAVNFTQGNYNVYLAPGAELNITGKSWDGKPNGILNDAHAVSLYLYDGSTYTGSLDSKRGTSLWIEGDYTIDAVSFDGDNDGRAYVHVGGTLYVNNLVTSNIDFVAENVVAGAWTMNNESHVMVNNLIDVEADVVINSQNVKVECQEFHAAGNFHMENNSDFYAYQHMTVDKDMTVATQGTVYTPCLIVKQTLYITNCATMNIPNYIYCDAFEASASGFTINMGGDALINATKTFTVSNKNWAINFANDAETWSAIATEKFQIMEGEAAYIWGYVVLSADEFWGKPSENTQYFLPDEDKVYNLQGTVHLGEVNITSAYDDCKPQFKTPEPPTPPSITELISSIEHTHDISATCVVLNNNGKGYLSWHKRGTSIHGCLEALVVEADTVRLTSWMEINDDDVEGGNNWDGNSAVGQTEETQGQFDFNHLIVAENMLVTVGDHAKMGGFIGGVALNAAGDFGTTLAYDENKFKARQLLPKEGQLGRSGNTVAYNNGKYYIACAGGFQEYDGKIADLLNRETKLGDYELTAGSAKHIAFNPAGDKVATLELTAKSAVQGDEDYWFNDTETAISAVLKVRTANDWLNTVDWEVNIGDICPIYGKNAIAMDANGDVYVSAGKQGLLVYNNGALKNSFSIAAENPRAAVNGVAIDDQYIYVAYSVAGVYILDKNDLSIVSWYKSSAPDHYETQAPCASANYIAVDGDYIYVAYGRHGVKVLKLVK